MSPSLYKLKPVTPPKQAEEEVKIEEIPTRGVQQPNKPNFNGFSPGTPPTTSSLFFAGPTPGTLSQTGYTWPSQNKETTLYGHPLFLTQ
jgi:hypothetical protein